MSIRKEQSEMTKAAILEAATDLFMNNSYSAVSTVNIAEKASDIIKTKYQMERSISKASIFNHFNSKEQLAIQVLNKLYIDVDKIVSQSLSHLSENNDVTTLIETMIYDMLTYFVKYPLMTQFTFNLMSEIDNDSEENEILNIFQYYMDQYNQECNNIFHDMGISDTEEKTRIFLALIDGLAMHLSIAQIGPGDPVIAKLSKEIRGIIRNWQIHEGNRND